MESAPANTGKPENSSPVRSSHRLRGNYSQTGPGYSIIQPLDRYTEAEHDRWRRLYQRQIALVSRYAVREFLVSLERLDISAGIPDFERISQHLSGLTGFRLLAVPGLIPDDAFFAHLANRRFPVTWWIRDENELDYLEEPDVGPNAAQMNAIPLLSRLYWYTIEFGLIQTAEGLRAYGSGILSSHAETVYSIDSDVPNRIAFDLERVLATEFRIDAYQETYFVIDSFEQLFAETHRPFAPLYARLQQQKPYGANTVLSADRVIHRGVGALLNRRP